MKVTNLRVHNIGPIEDVKWFQRTLASMSSRRAA